MTTLRSFIWIRAFAAAILAASCTGCGLPRQDHEQRTIRMHRRLAGQEYRLERVFADSFRDTGQWRCEGAEARMWTHDGWLHCDAQAGDVHAATIWCTAAAFSDPVWVEFDIRFLAGEFNGNLVLHASGTDGSDILASSGTRKGNYDEYHVFPNYIVTFLNDAGSTRIRYRRNPGFALLGETFYQPCLELDRTYHVVLILEQGRLRFFVDGIERYEARDTGAPLTFGRLGLRTWKTYLGWSNFIVARVAPEESRPQ